MNNKLTLKEIQNEEIKILKKTVEFLDENKIQYFLGYGSLLGAVRHKGFIPWDDDIDLIILRPDYEKLLSILKKLNCKFDGLDFTGYELNNSLLPFIKVVNKEIVIEKELNYENYLWVDIFPVDAVPNKFINLYYKRIKVLNIICALKRRDILSCGLGNCNAPVKLVKKFFILLLKPIRYSYLIERYIKLCRKYNYDAATFLSNNVWAEYKCEMILKSKFEADKYKFDNLIVNGMKDFDYYLSRLYGKDYMTPPPSDKRISHGFIARRVNHEK